MEGNRNREAASFFLPSRAQGTATMTNGFSAFSPYVVVVAASAASAEVCVNSYGCAVVRGRAGQEEEEEGGSLCAANPEGTGIRKLANDKSHLSWVWPFRRVLLIVAC